jgi:enterochelin esterase-like enzyme
MSRFKTIELSNPEHESGNLRQITVKSPALKGRGDITVFVPPGMGKAGLPLVLLLHGVYGSHWAWTGLGGVHQSALALMEARKLSPMVIAMPSDGLWGDGSAYVPHHGQDFEKWIMEDVVDVCRECIPQAGPAGPLFISGLSMGGYGALRLGSKHPQRFKAVSAHSSVTDLAFMDDFATEGHMDRVKMAPGEEGSVLKLCIANRKVLPPLRFDCGREDGLLENNRDLHKGLLGAGIAHQYEEFPGGHEWGYWREHVKDSLLFFEENLKP